MTPSERNRLKARLRRLCSARNSRHGPPPASVDDWWLQIQAIAEEWGQPITWDEWCQADERSSSEQA